MEEKKSSVSHGVRIVRGAVAGLLLTGLLNIFLLAGGLLIPRILSRTEYAQFTVAISFVSLMALVADLGLDGLIVKLFAEAQDDDIIGREDRRGTILGSVLILKLFMVVIVAGLVLVVGSLFYTPTMINNMAIVLVTLLISSRLFVVRSACEAVLKSHRKYYLYAAFALFDAFIFFTFLFAFRNDNLSIRQVLWIYTFCNLPGFLMVLVWLFIWMHKEGVTLKLNVKMIKYILRTAIPLGLATAFLTVRSQADYLLLDKLSSPFEVSNYGVAIRLLSAAFPVPLVLGGVAAPEITRLLKHGDIFRSRQLTDLLLRTSLVLSILAALFVSSTSEEIMSLLFGTKYISAAPFLLWTAWMLVPIFAATLIVHANNAAGEFWLPTMYALVIMITVIVGDLLLIEKFGAAGALTSKLIGESLGFIALMWLSRNSLYMNPRGILIALMRAGIAALAAGLIAIGITPVGWNNWIHGIISIAVFLILMHLTGLLTIREIMTLSKKLWHSNPNLVLEDSQ